MKPKTHLKLVLALVSSILLLLPLYINIRILHYQTAAFAPTTIKMGELIKHFGNLDSARDYVLSSWKLGFWQSHIRDYILYEFLSGIFVYEISSVTGFSIKDSMYLPVVYFLYILDLILIGKLAYKGLECYGTKINKLLAGLIVISSIYGFIALFVVGLFYTFEYHGLFYAYALTMYYLLFKILSKKTSSIKKLLLTVIIIYIATLFTHYEIPLSSIGGLGIYLVTTYVLTRLGIVEKRDGASRSAFMLLIIFITLLSMQNFYFMIAHKTEINVIVHLLSLIIVARLLHSSNDTGALVGSVYPYGKQLLASKIIWHLSFVAVIILVVYSILRDRYSLDKTKWSPADFFWVFILGRDATWMISYFTAYKGTFSFELKWAWLLNMIVFLPVFKLHKQQRNIQWKTLVISFAVIFSVSLLIWSSIQVHMYLGGYAPLSGEVRAEVSTITPFLIRHIYHHETWITGSLQATAKIYEDLPHYLLEGVYIYPLMIYARIPDSKQHKSIPELYFTLNSNNIDFMIITNHEYRKGMFGGLTIAPFTPKEVRVLSTVLLLEKGRVYTSGEVDLFRLSN